MNMFGTKRYITDCKYINNSSIAITIEPLLDRLLASC